MSNILLMISRRPEITEELIDLIRHLIEKNPDKGRSWLSVKLCEIWDWRDFNGKTKDMSCRDMLRALDKAGKITLPPPKSTGGGQPRNSVLIKHFNHDESPIVCKLKELQPLKVEIAFSKESMAQFKSIVDQYHYLKYRPCVGESMAYTIYSNSNQILACLLFGASAWACRDRDVFIGWRKEDRRNNLIFTTNNVRFVILPFVKVAHLASHILSIISKRISSDWESKYGHPIYLLETFVEVGRFKGTCYKAANWINVGRTTGRGRDGGHKHAILPYKDIHLFPLAKDWKRHLSEL